MRTLSLLALLLLCAGLAGRPRPVAAQAARPNIVLFLADDLGYGDLGCYGHPVIRTPHLDAFARQGVRMMQCYAASAVCSPSRSALLTGRTPHRNGVYTWIAAGSEVHLRPSEVTLPKLLKGAGYATCHTGKWHLNGKFNDPAQPQPGDHGYDWWLATQNNAAPSHANPTNFVRNGQPVGPLEGYSAPLVVNEAVTWLKEKRDTSRPFFLAVWTHEPHYPIKSDPAFKALYPALTDEVQKEHHANVTQMDHAFGRLMAALDEQKLTDNTLVVFTSDNGPEGDGIRTPGRGSSGGLRGRKRDIHEGGIRVPGMARWPGRIRPGTTTDTPVIGSDMFPTLLAAAGVRPPADRVIDGVDVTRVLRGEAQAVERPQPLYWRLHMAPNAKVALREGDWKLLADETLSTFELYNLKADPQETNDLKEKEPRRFEELRERLRRHQAAVDAEGPDWWKRLSPNGGGPRPAAAAGATVPQAPAAPATRVYKRVGDRDLKLTLVNPPGWKASDRRPAMVFFHGGGWTGGRPTQFDQQAAYLAGRGLVCLQAEYRLLDKDGADPPLVCVQDAKSAMRWVRAHAAELGIDPNRIGAGGGSAGGHLAAFVGMVAGLDDPQDDRAVAARANALALFNPVFDNGPEQGWGTARVRDRYKEFSPAHNISADDPPAIVFLGTNDRLIPVPVVRRFEAGMKAAGVRCEVRLYEGQGHGFFNPGRAAGDRRYFTETLIETDRFLASLGWLQGEPTLKPPD